MSQHAAESALEASSSTDVPTSRQPEHPKELDFALLYAGKFWDAGNLVVTVMFGLAFGIYYLASQHPAIRIMMKEQYYYLLPLAVIGNIALGAVIYRLNHHELRFVEALTSSAHLHDSVKSAYHLRLGMFAFNAVLYIAVLTLNRVIPVHTRI